MPYDSLMALACPWPGISRRPSGFMEFTRFSLGQIFQKQHGDEVSKIMRLAISNLPIMR
jgi:hypothetical protein